MANGIKAILVEDEAPQRETLEFLLRKYCTNVAICAGVDSVRAGVQAIAEHKPDLVFLDVELPDGDCFELLEQCGQLSFAVVFVTAHNHYAIRAIKFSALDYLLKPVIISELKAAVAKAAHYRHHAAESESRYAVLKENLHNAAGELQRLALPTLEGYTFVECATIMRLEAEGSYTRIYFRNGDSVLVSRSLGDFEDPLLRQHFFRVHNSHIVNLKEVHKYVKGKSGHVVLRNGVSITVSMRRKDAFMEHLKRC